MSRYIAMQPLVPGKRVDILERNNAGHLIGAWFGYWNFKRGVVALYPNVTNHAVNWPGGRVPKGKKSISIRLVDYPRTLKMPVTVQSANSLGTEKKGVGFPGPSGTSSGGSKGETWRDRKMPLPGQERMKI